MAFKSKHYYFILFYVTKLCVFHKRNFPKLISKMQVSFVNKAAEIYRVNLKFTRTRGSLHGRFGKALACGLGGPQFESQREVFL
jgi:hypothetical protein